MAFDKDSTERDAKHRILSGMLMYRKAGYGLWHVLKMVGEAWPKAGEELLRLQNGKRT